MGFFHLPGFRVLVFFFGAVGEPDKVRDGNRGVCVSKSSHVIVPFDVSIMAVLACADIIPPRSATVSMVTFFISSSFSLFRTRASCHPS